MASVFLNGEFLERDSAKVSAFDAGFQHGVGLFETMLALRDRDAQFKVLHLAEHLDRLAVSARELGLSESIRVGALGEAVQRTCEHAANAPDAPARLRVRLSITGGDLNLLGRGGQARESTPTVLIVAQPATEYPGEMFKAGVLATLADLKANPLDATQGHKTLNYWARLRELQRAAAGRAGEALVFSVTNHLAGGCVSNAFVVRDGVIATPIARGEEEEVARGDVDLEEPQRSPRGVVLPSPVLPGIVRRWVMDWSLSEGVACERRMLTIDDVLRADELFLTNSSWGVLPVVRFEAETIGSGSPGPISERLVGAWAELTAH